MIIFSKYLMWLICFRRLTVSFVRESYEEIRRVVWPGLYETLYTTFVVCGVTCLMSLILWGLDSILVYFVSLSLRL